MQSANDADLQRPDGAVLEEFGEVDLGAAGEVRSWACAV
jgi:hypothetical protein